MASEALAFLPSTLPALRQSSKYRDYRKFEADSELQFECVETARRFRGNGMAAGRKTAQNHRRPCHLVMNKPRDERGGKETKWRGLVYHGRGCGCAVSVWFLIPSGTARNWDRMKTTGRALPR